MADPDPERTRLELDVEPTIASRLTRWMRRVRAVRSSIEAARGAHASIDFVFDLIERDSSIGGGLLAGALAYRLFVLLLPSALLFVSGLGLYAGTVDQSPAKVARESGLHGLIASEVATTAASGARGLVFVLMVPAVLYALVKLYRSLAVVHAIVWRGSGRGVRTTAKGVLIFGGAFLLDVFAAGIVGWIRRQDQLGGLSALLLYFMLAGAAWLVVSLLLPHRAVHWLQLVPGAAVFGVGLLFVNIFNVYVTTRLVEDRANTYGALGVATALLLSLVLVGRVVVIAAEVNAELDERRGGRHRD